MQETVKYDRHKWLGGSDIPVIMSLSPFKTRWKLLREKAQLEEDTFQGSIYTEYGNIMEPKIRDYINEGLGFGFEEGKAYDEARGIRIHTDGEDVLKDTILEVKTTSHIYSDPADYKIYLVQLLFYMVERNMNYGLLAVYERPEDLNTEFDPNRLMTYPIERKDYEDLITEIYEEVERFKSDLVKIKENPFITEEELIPAETRLVARQIIAIKEAEKFLKDEFLSQKDALVERLGELYAAEKRKTAEIGGYKVTFTPSKGSTTKAEEKANLEMLKANFPKAYKTCVLVEEKTVAAKKASVTLTKLKEG